MDKLKVVALACSILAIGAAAYAVAVPYPKYEDANREWMEAGRYRNSGPPVYGDPVYDAYMRQAADREREAEERRSRYRNESQTGVIAAMVPGALGLILGALSLKGEKKGLAVMAIVGALIAGGLVSIMLAAGVF